MGRVCDFSQKEAILGNEPGMRFVTEGSCFGPRAGYVISHRRKLSLRPRARYVICHRKKLFGATGRVCDLSQKEAILGDEPSM